MGGPAARLHCSNCGAELTNMTMSWGRHQWLWTLGYVAFVFGAMYVGQWYLFGRDGSYVDEVEASLVDVRPAADRVEVVGKLKNLGKHTWVHFNVEAEFFDGSGKFLDETTAWRVPATLSPEGEENFKLTLMTSDERILKGKPKVVVKVADADLARF